MRCLAGTTIATRDERATLHFNFFIGFARRFFKDKLFHRARTFPQSTFEYKTRFIQYNNVL